MASLEYKKTITALALCKAIGTMMLKDESCDVGLAYMAKELQKMAGKAIIAQGEVFTLEDMHHVSQVIIDLKKYISSSGTYKGNFPHSLCMELLYDRAKKIKTADKRRPILDLIDYLHSILEYIRDDDLAEYGDVVDFFTKYEKLW